MRPSSIRPSLWTSCTHVRNGYGLLGALGTHVDAAYLLGQDAPQVVVHEQPAALCVRTARALDRFSLVPQRHAAHGMHAVQTRDVPAGQKREDVADVVDDSAEVHGAGRRGWLLLAAAGKLIRRCASLTPAGVLNDEVQVHVQIARAPTQRQSRRWRRDDGALLDRRRPRGGVPFPVLCQGFAEVRAVRPPVPLEFVPRPSGLEPHRLPRRLGVARRRSVLGAGEKQPSAGRDPRGPDAPESRALHLGTHRNVAGRHEHLEGDGPSRRLWWLSSLHGARVAESVHVAKMSNEQGR